MEFNREGLIQDTLGEFIRCNTLKSEAFCSGKSSKAKVNINKLAKKYYLSNEGHAFLDMFVAGVIMKTMFNGYTTNTETLRTAITQSFDENIALLEKELSKNTSQSEEYTLFSY